MKVVSYSGKEPQFIPPKEQEKILDIMLKQLEVLKAMAATVVVIPEGTKLRTSEVKE